jgi:hypothetical protein
MFLQDARESIKRTEGSSERRKRERLRQSLVNVNECEWLGLPARFYKAKEVDLVYLL